MHKIFAEHAWLYAVVATIGEILATLIAFILDDLCDEANVLVITGMVAVTVIWAFSITMFCRYDKA